MINTNAKVQNMQTVIKNELTAVFCAVCVCSFGQSEYEIRKKCLWSDAKFYYTIYSA